MNRTTWLKAKDIKRNWYVFDVEGKTLGRASVMIARYLMGKNSVRYSNHVDMGNHVIVINVEKIALTGEKKNYLDIRRYSGYPGGLKKLRVKDLLVNKPADVIKHSIKGMLPNNKLRDRNMARLYLYAGSTHPHEAQKPEKINL